jgi:hypothetical protein
MMRSGDYAPMLNGIVWPQFTLAVAFVMLRVYTRRTIIRSLGLDDLLITLSLVCYLLSL